MNGRNKHHQAGFTLIEVMIAIGIMTVGSLGILSMHHAVSGANRSAQEMNTALAITERWIERIERDSLSWSEPGITSSTLTGTDYFAPLANTNSGTDWLKPTPWSSEESYASDYFGNDASDRGATKYCTNIRLRWLREGRSARVDVRTFWYRAGHMPGTATHPDWVFGSDFASADCDAATADGWGLIAAPNVTEAPNVDVVFASTVVQWMRRD
jgi:prepilin-type N-terminal cleavage/methylation domain-containing protein